MKAPSRHAAAAMIMGNILATPKPNDYTSVAQSLKNNLASSIPSFSVADGPMRGSIVPNAKRKRRRRMKLHHAAAHYSILPFFRQVSPYVGSDIQMHELVTLAFTDILTVVLYLTDPDLLAFLDNRNTPNCPYFSFSHFLPPTVVYSFPSCHHRYYSSTTAMSLTKKHCLPTAQTLSRRAGLLFCIGLFSMIHTTS